MKNSFEKYAELAESELSTTEIVGRYKHQMDSEKFIFNDIISKMPSLEKNNISICDIGCGCGTLVKDLISLSDTNKNTLVLIDSESMLNRIEDKGCIEKVTGKFPLNQAKIQKKFDAIIVYSVLQYVFMDDNVYSFIDSCVEMLNYGGELLLGDIPNASKKKRFLRSEFGVNIHNKTSTSNINNLINDDFNKLLLDDSFVLSLLARYRNMGFNTYLLPHNEKLPFSYTREDILITKGYK